MKDYEMMRKEIGAHCMSYVSEDPYDDNPCMGCPLENTKIRGCYGEYLNYKEIETNYNTLIEKGYIKTNDIDVKAIMEEKPIEHDGCGDCKHMWTCDDDKYPCVECKGTAITSSEEYKTRADLYEPKEPTEDIINHPNHYTNGGMECIDEMLLIFGKRVVADFCLCNVWKYRYRATTKNGDEDIQKSHWYMAKYKEIVDGINDCYTFDAYSNGVTCAEECCDDWECK